MRALGATLRRAITMHYDAELKRKV
jgi:hypothetical protein